jgi:hypothetical protein
VDEEPQTPYLGTSVEINRIRYRHMKHENLQIWMVL